MNDYDVAIIGGRVAGASTALLLARAGLRVVLLERARSGSDTVSTHALMRGGVLQLSRWGVLPEVVAAGTPPVRSVAFHYGDGEPTRVSLRASPGVDGALRATAPSPRPRAHRRGRSGRSRRPPRDSGAGTAARRGRARPRGPRVRRRAP